MMKGIFEAKMKRQLSWWKNYSMHTAQTQWFRSATFLFPLTDVASVEVRGKKGKSRHWCTKWMGRLNMAVDSTTVCHLVFREERMEKWELTSINIFLSSSSFKGPFSPPFIDNTSCSRLNGGFSKEVSAYSSLGPANATLCGKRVFQR